MTDTETDIQRRPPFGQQGPVGERGSDTRRRILEAALTVFDEVGFNGARVELISQAAGCSRPSFYQYFSSKDDVFWKLAARLGNEMVHLCQRLEVVTPDADGVERLEHWTDEFLTLRKAYAPVFSAFQSASRQDQEFAQGSRMFGDRMSAAILTSFGSRHKGPQASAIAHGIVGVITQAGAIWDRILSSKSHDRLVRGLALFIHRVICGSIEGVNLPDPVRVRIARSPAQVADEPALALQPRGQKTRQLLLDAGAKVLPMRGFHDARVDDIVEVAGLSHGSFYRYFDSKDDLFRVLAAQASTLMLAQFDAFSLSDSPQGLRKWLRSWITEYRAYGGVFSTWQELSSADPDLVRMGDQAATVTLNRLVAILSERTFGDPLVDGIAFLALLDRLPYAVVTSEMLHEDQAIEAMVLMMRRGLSGRK